MATMTVSQPNPWGVHYFRTETPTAYEPDLEQLYFFKAYIGHHEIEVERGDCVYYFDQELNCAKIEKGPVVIESQHLATVIRGYMHPDASSSLRGVTTLPYVNGCSTRQIFPPVRIGDPTLQYLKIPPFSKEQEHHIHSTYRVVLIAAGYGKSVVGLEAQNQVQELTPGTVCILEPMCPHHFETTTQQPLIALPLHVFSAAGPSERNHPMFNGTVMI